MTSGFVWDDKTATAHPKHQSAGWRREAEAEVVETRAHPRLL